MKHSHSRMAAKVAKPIGNNTCLASLTSSCLAFAISVLTHSLAMLLDDTISSTRSYRVERLPAPSNSPA